MKRFVPFELILTPDLVFRVPKRVVLRYLNSFTYDHFLLGGLYFEIICNLCLLVEIVIAVIIKVDHVEDVFDWFV